MPSSPLGVYKPLALTHSYNVLVFQTTQILLEHPAFTLIPFLRILYRLLVFLPSVHAD